MTLLLSDYLTQLRNLREKAQSFAGTAAELRTFLFSKKQGEFTTLTKQLALLPADQRREAGQSLQQIKMELEQILHNLQPITQHSWQDATLPASNEQSGHRHPVSQTIDRVTSIFSRLGFIRVRYPEADWDHYAFTALNMPANHPARDEWETFFLDLSEGKKGKVVLTPHTSNGQVREMERLGKPPIRMINITRTYRRQQDATHTPMFHQFEGLVVDKNISIAHLKGTIDAFTEAFYGPGTKSRLRPFHFQFTEPSFEVDFSCTICHGTGRVDNDRCKFCKSGWHEVGGAGMVHPNVLLAGGIDPNIYSGFAFGWGIERTFALQPNLHLDDIRKLYDNDLNFLEQF